MIFMKTWISQGTPHGDRTASGFLDRHGAEALEDCRSRRQRQQLKPGGSMRQKKKK
jgi:hypothetical protein